MVTERTTVTIFCDPSASIGLGGYHTVTPQPIVTITRARVTPTKTSTHTNVYSSTGSAPPAKTVTSTLTSSTSPSVTKTHITTITKSKTLPVEVVTKTKLPAHTTIPASVKSKHKSSANFADPNETRLPEHPSIPTPISIVRSSRTLQVSSKTKVATGYHPSATEDPINNILDLVFHNKDSHARPSHAKLEHDDDDWEPECDESLVYGSDDDDSEQDETEEDEPRSQEGVCAHLEHIELELTNDDAEHDDSDHEGHTIDDADQSESDPDDSNPCDSDDDLCFVGLHVLPPTKTHNSKKPSITTTLKKSSKADARKTTDHREHMSSPSIVAVANKPTHSVKTSTTSASHTTVLSSASLRHDTTKSLPTTNKASVSQSSLMTLFPSVALPTKGKWWTNTTKTAVPTNEDFPEWLISLVAGKISNENPVIDPVNPVSGTNGAASTPANFLQSSKSPSAIKTFSSKPKAGVVSPFPTRFRPTTTTSPVSLTEAQKTRKSSKQSPPLTDSTLPTIVSSSSSTVGPTDVDFPFPLLLPSETHAAYFPLDPSYSSVSSISKPSLKATKVKDQALSPNVTVTVHPVAIETHSAGEQAHKDVAKPRPTQDSLSEGATSEEDGEMTEKCKERCQGLDARCVGICKYYYFGIDPGADLTHGR
ncbi:hypothetical protein N0V90_006419 [Kalmusia sp. IMI 367209]|nr:hypothetical protein N0V90_006419 [Kalmusia sp. IMI 367209]